jgi:hypothetical protein
LRADEAPAPRDRWKLHIISKPEHGEGERLRVLARRVRAGDEQTFEAVAFQVRDSRRCERHGCFVGCLVGFSSRASFCASPSFADAA